MPGCPKCHGPMDQEEIGGQAFWECRNIMCGGRILSRPRRGERMGGAWTPERRAKFEATMAERRAGRAGGGGDAEARPVPEKSTRGRKPGRARAEAAKDGSAISQAIAAIDAKIERLQEVRARLLEAEELLTA